MAGLTNVEKMANNLNKTNDEKNTEKSKKEVFKDLPKLEETL